MTLFAQHIMFIGLKGVETSLSSQNMRFRPLRSQNMRFCSSRGQNMRFCVYEQTKEAILLFQQSNFVILSNQNIQFCSKNVFLVVDESKDAFLIVEQSKYAILNSNCWSIIRFSNDFIYFSVKNNLFFKANKMHVPLESQSKKPIFLHVFSLI